MVVGIIAHPIILETIRLNILRALLDKPIVVTTSEIVTDFDQWLFVSSTSNVEVAFTGTAVDRVYIQHKVPESKRQTLKQNTPYSKFIEFEKGWI